MLDSLSVKIFLVEQRDQTPLIWSEVPVTFKMFMERNFVSIVNENRRSNKYWLSPTACSLAVKSFRFSELSSSNFFVTHWIKGSF